MQPETGLAEEASRESREPPAPVAIEADPSLFINRELSWIEFNQRVLDEAHDPSVPLIERLKFAAITAANLDEFFMVRIAGLYGQIHDDVNLVTADGLSAREQLEVISRRVRRMRAELNSAVVG